MPIAIISSCRGPHPAASASGVGNLVILSLPHIHAGLGISPIYFPYMYLSPMYLYMYISLYLPINIPTYNLSISTNLSSISIYIYHLSAIIYVSIIYKFTRRCIYLYMYLSSIYYLSTMIAFSLMSNHLHFF